MVNARKTLDNLVYNHSVRLVVSAAAALAMSLPALTYAGGTSGKGRKSAEVNIAEKKDVDLSDAKVDTTTSRLAVDDPEQCIDKVKDFYTQQGGLGPTFFPMEIRRKDYKGLPYSFVEYDYGIFFKEITGLSETPFTVVRVHSDNGTGYKFYKADSRGFVSDAEANLIYPVKGFSLPPNDTFTKERYKKEGVVLKPCELLFLFPETPADNSGDEELIGIIDANRKAGRTAKPGAPPIVTASVLDIVKDAHGAFEELKKEETAAPGSIAALVGELSLKYGKGKTLNLDTSSNFFLTPNTEFTAVSTQSNDTVCVYPTDELIKKVNAIKGIENLTVLVWDKKPNRTYDWVAKKTTINDGNSLATALESPHFPKSALYELCLYKSTKFSVEPNSEYFVLAMDSEKIDESTEAIALHRARVFARGVGKIEIKDDKGKPATTLSEGYRIATNQTKYVEGHPELSDQDVVWFGSVDELANNLTAEIYTWNGVRYAAACTALPPAKINVADIKANPETTLKNPDVLQELISSLYVFQKMKPEWTLPDIRRGTKYVLLAADRVGLDEVVAGTYTAPFTAIASATITTPGTPAEQRRPLEPREYEPGKVYGVAGVEAAKVEIRGNQVVMPVDTKYVTCLVPPTAFVGATVNGKTLAADDLTTASQLQGVIQDAGARVHAVATYTDGKRDKCTDKFSSAMKGPYIAISVDPSEVFK